MTPFELREQAERCRRLAANITDDRAVSALKALAEQSEQMACECDSAPEPELRVLA